MTRLVRLLEICGESLPTLVIVSTRLAVAILNRLIAKLAGLWIFRAFVASWHTILALVANDVALTLQNRLGTMIANPIRGLFFVNVHR